MKVSTVSIPILALSSDQCLQANKSCEKSKDALVLSKSNDDGGEYSMMLRGRQSGSQRYSRVVYTVRSFLQLLHFSPVWVVRPVRSGCVAFKRRESGRRAFMYRRWRDGGSEVRKIGFLEES